LDRCRTPVARNAYAEEVGIDPVLLFRWTQMADLMRIEGIGQQMAELLMLSGIDSVKKLSHTTPEEIIESLQNPGILPVKNLKIDDEFDIVEGSANLREAAKQMVDNNLPDLVVCQDKAPKGVLTFRNIVRALAEGKDVDKVSVADVMVKDAQLLNPDTQILIAAEKLIDAKLPVLPVVENNELVGVLSRFDIEDVFLKISKRRPSLEEVGRWVVEAKKHKTIFIR
jgi:CBS domain-containing protein